MKWKKGEYVSTLHYINEDLFYNKFRTEKSIEKAFEVFTTCQYEQAVCTDKQRAFLKEHFNIIIPEGGYIMIC